MVTLGQNARRSKSAPAAAKSGKMGAKATYSPPRTNTWERRKLGEIVDRVTRKNTNNESSLPLTISAQHGLVDQITYFNNRVASRDVSNYFLVHNGEFAYNKSSSDGFPFGAIKRLDLYESGVLSTLYIVFSIKTGYVVDSDYLTIFFDTDRWHKGVSERAAEGARNHGLLNIAAEDFLEIGISIPKPIIEQQKLGTFFRSLDRLITLHQRKYDKLANIEKSMPEKMFPENDETFPAVRFAGFTNAWERRKLGEVGVITTGSTPSTSVPEYYSKDGIPWVTPTDIKSNIIYETERKLSKLGQVISRVVPENTILVTCIASIGKNSMLLERGSFNQQINGLTPNKRKYEPYFLLTESYLWSEQMKSSAAAGTMQIVNRTEFSELSTWVPYIEEQKKIGTFFRSLDRLITLHQRKLEKMETLRKALLEHMSI